MAASARSVRAHPPPTTTHWSTLLFSKTKDMRSAFVLLYIPLRKNLHYSARCSQKTKHKKCSL